MAAPDSPRTVPERRGASARAADGTGACPTVTFTAEPGAPSDGAGAPIRATVVLPTREPVAARLVDAGTGRVLAAERGEGGTVTLRCAAPREAGTHVLAVEVLHPAGCPGAAATLIVPAARAGDVASADSAAAASTQAGRGEEVVVRVDAPAGSHLWAVDEDACEPPGHGDPAADGRTVRVDILTAGDRRRVYARLERRGGGRDDGHAPPAREDGDDGDVDAEGESRGGKAVGIGWMLVLAAVLVSMAAGAGPGRSPLLTGGAMAVVAAALGAFLAVSPARFWGKWTFGAVGVAAAATVLLLIFTQWIRWGHALASAGIAATGFALAAAAVSVRMPWRARPQRGARRTPHQPPEEA